MQLQGYSRQQRGAGLEQDAQIRQVQQYFAKLARQPSEKVISTCELLASIAPHKNTLKSIQDHVVKDLSSSKKQLQDTQAKLKTLVARLRDLDKELPAAIEKYEGEGDGEILFRRTFYVLGLASGVALTTCGWGRLAGLCLAVTGIAGAFWALTASETSISKKKFDQLDAEAKKQMQDIEAAGAQEAQLKGHIRAIMRSVQEALAQANISAESDEEEKAPQREPIACAIDFEEEESPRSQRSFFDQRAFGRLKPQLEEQDLRRQQMNLLYDLLRQQSASRFQQSENDEEREDHALSTQHSRARFQLAESDDESEDDHARSRQSGVRFQLVDSDSDTDDDEEGFNLWDDQS